jgi:hypothetical protein
MFLNAALGFELRIYLDCVAKKRQVRVWLVS